jgi:hypothetical protein
MGKAAGKTGLRTRQADRSLFKKAHLRGELTKLQLLDALVGQGDRHANNYFIHEEPNDWFTVTGIDNDQCFGGKVTDPNGIAQGRTEDTMGFRGVRLPPVVDTEMADAFDQLSPDHLDDLLGDKLSRDEVNAAKQRLQGIKNHINDLRTNHPDRVIDPSQWGSDTVSQLLIDQNSYASREGRRQGQW